MSTMYLPTFSVIVLQVSYSQVQYCSIPAETLPPKIAAGASFTSVCINTALYLPYLVTQCQRHGVRFRTQKIEHIKEAISIPHPSGKMPRVVINATGLGSRWLKGVEDGALYPARGQTALVQNDPGYMMAVSKGSNGKGLGYCMTRAAGAYSGTLSLSAAGWLIILSVQVVAPLLEDVIKRTISTQRSILT